MKKVNPFILGILGILAFSVSAFAQSKIALINTDAFYDEKLGIAKLVAANKQLDIEFATQIKALEESGTKLQALAAELQNMQKLPAQQFNQTAFNSKRDEGERLEREFNYKKTELENAINKRRGTLISPISQDIGKAITEFGKKNGYTAIFDIAKLDDAGAILFLAETADVTKEFITFYNTRPAATVTTPK